MIEQKKAKTNVELWEEVYQDTITEQKEPELKTGLADLDYKVFGLHTG